MSFWRNRLACARLKTDNRCGTLGKAAPTRSLPSAALARTTFPPAGGLPAMSVARRLGLVCLGLGVLSLQGWAADRSEEDKLWAFQRPRHAAPPAVRAPWGRNAIDAYILS